MKIEKFLGNVIWDLPSGVVDVGVFQFAQQENWTTYFEKKMNETNFFGEATPPDMYVSIVDGFTLLCLSHQDQKKVKEDLDMEKGVYACKYKSQACATYNLLLKDLLPPQLAPPVNKRTLGSFKSHAEYDTLNDHN